MPIDRKAILNTYSPKVERWDPASFVSVGNGEFATTVDYTGMQTILPSHPAATPLATMASWGFHSYPDSMVGRYDLLQRKTYQGSKGPVGYMSDAAGQEALFETLRINPHRFNLARFSLFTPALGTTSLIEQISEAQQRLDLFSGTITSTYRLLEDPVTVITAVHPELDQLSVSLASEADLGMLLSFPYPSHQKDGSNWEAEEFHTTNLISVGKNRWKIARIVDQTLYTVEILTNTNAQLSLIGTHQVLIQKTSKTLEINMLFSPNTAEQVHPVDFAQCIQASAAHWQRFWLEGGFVDVTASEDRRAGELQRRILLSQYLLAIQSSGSTPPAETGLTCNSWYGKFHLEM
ncbi:MAG TPA: hypothetical protein VFC80_04955, partial [Sphaerochaeta sp.]|nr:hypothetical protein [Sphaerochaeta sp.]